MNKKKDALLKTSSYRNFIRRWDSATYDNMFVRGVEYAVKAVVNAYLQAVGVELFNEFLAKNDEKNGNKTKTTKNFLTNRRNIKIMAIPAVYRIFCRNCLPKIFPVG